MRTPRRAASRSSSAAQALDAARAERWFRCVHAFPSVENAPSNGLCRRLGFDLVRECEFEFPAGNLMRCNDWQFELWDKQSCEADATWRT
jgi:RimJ/RimL family protein N-acetyltransferase